MLFMCRKRCSVHCREMPHIPKALELGREFYGGALEDRTTLSGIANEPTWTIRYSGGDMSATVEHECEVSWHSKRQREREISYLSLRPKMMSVVPSVDVLFRPDEVFSFALRVSGGHRLETSRAFERLAYDELVRLKALDKPEKVIVRSETYRAFGSRKIPVPQSAPLERKVTADADDPRVKQALKDASRSIRAGLNVSSDAVHLIDSADLYWSRPRDELLVTFFRRTADPLGASAEAARPGTPTTYHLRPQEVLLGTNDFAFETAVLLALRPEWRDRTAEMQTMMSWTVFDDSIIDELSDMCASESSIQALGRLRQRNDARKAKIWTRYCW